jgi:hypothetical protein
MGEFYVYLTVYNFQRTSAEADYLQSCGMAWRNLFLQLESSLEALLVEVLKLKPLEGAKNITVDQMAKAIEDKVPDGVKRAVEWKEIRKHPLRLAAYYYDDLVGGKGHLSRFRKNLNEISQIRNWLSHSGHYGPFEDFINLRDVDWPGKFEKIENRTTQLWESIADVEEEHNSRRQK